MAPLLAVENLQTEFHTPDGIVKAVNGISYTLNEGEILGIVGESGSGKSVSVLSLLQLLPHPPAYIKAGTAVFDGRDLLQMSTQETGGTSLWQWTMKFDQSSDSQDIPDSFFVVN